MSQRDRDAQLRTQLGEAEKRKQRAQEERNAAVLREASKPWAEIVIVFAREEKKAPQIFQNAACFGRGDGWIEIVEYSNDNRAHRYPSGPSGKIVEMVLTPSKIESV